MPTYILLTLILVIAAKEGVTLFELSNCCERDRRLCAEDRVTGYRENIVNFGETLWA
jgi:hypothetical protein